MTRNYFDHSCKARLIFVEIVLLLNCHLYLVDSLSDWESFYDINDQRIFTKLRSTCHIWGFCYARPNIVYRIVNELFWFESSPRIWDMTLQGTPDFTIVSSNSRSHGVENFACKWKIQTFEISFFNFLYLKRARRDFSCRWQGRRLKL